MKKLFLLNLAILFAFLSFNLKTVDSEFLIYNMSNNSHLSNASINNANSRNNEISNEISLSTSSINIQTQKFNSISSANDFISRNTTYHFESFRLTRASYKFTTYRYVMYGESGGGGGCYLSNTQEETRWLRVLSLSSNKLSDSVQADSFQSISDCGSEGFGGSFISTFSFSNERLFFSSNNATVSEIEITYSPISIPSSIENVYIQDITLNSANLYFDFKKNNGNGNLNILIYDNDMDLIKNNSLFFETDFLNYKHPITSLEKNQNYNYQIWVDGLLNYTNYFTTQGVTEVIIKNIIGFDSYAIVSFDYFKNNGNGLVYSRIYDFYTPQENLPSFEIDIRFMPQRDGSYDIALTALNPGVNYVLELVGHSIFEGQFNKKYFITQNSNSRSYISNVEGIIAPNGRTIINYSFTIKNNINGPIEYLYYEEGIINEDFNWRSFPDKPISGDYSETFLERLDPEKKYDLIMRVNKSNYIYSKIESPLYIDEEIDAQIEILEIDVWESFAWIDFNLILNNGIGQIEFKVYREDDFLNSENYRWINIGILPQGFNTLVLKELQSQISYLTEIRVDYKNIYLVKVNT